MSLQDEIEELKPWFHNLHLPDGTQTAPGHPLGDFPAFKWKELESEIPEDLTGRKVLDIGCNAGYYSIEMAKRGAEVTGIDLDDHYLAQAQWAAEKFGLDHKITFRNMQVYDLARLEEKYDVIWFMGVFYHLRYPLLALDIISRKVEEDGLLVFQTLSMQGVEEMEIPENTGFDERGVFHQKAWPKMAFIENKLSNDPTNWWVANHQGILSMLGNCGFEIISRPGHEMYIGRMSSGKNEDHNRWNRSEYLSAIGMDWQTEIGHKTRDKNEILK